MHADISAITLTEEELQAKVGELARQVSLDYAGEDVLLIGIMKGSTFFLTDLSRRLTCELVMDYMTVSSYGAGTRSSGTVRVLKDLDVDIRDRHVLIVEDIVDSGNTLSYLLEMLGDRRPASLKICALLDKPSRREQQVPIAYKGFTIPDLFVVGYGMDYNQRYRHLPYIGVLRPEVYLRDAQAQTDVILQPQ